MTAKRFLLAWVSAALALMLADGLWLGVLMGPTYRAQLGAMMLEQPRWLPALAFYALYPVGLVVFTVLPSLAGGRWQRAAALGCLFGLVAYATYDLSNLATLKGWPVAISLIDMAWGALASLACATVSFLVTRRFAATPAP